MTASIELFSFNRKLSHVVGIYPLQSNQNDQPLINSRNWIFVISFLLFGLSSAAFFGFEAKSMFEYGISFFATSIAIFPMCIYLIMIWEIKNTEPFIENCERFIENRVKSIIPYRELIEKIERLCEFVGIAGIISVLFVTLKFLLYSLVNYYILDLPKESFLLFFPAKWPFDSKTPLHYFVAWFVQCVGITALTLTSIIFVNFILGSCWLFMFMAEDITKELAVFNNIVKSNKKRTEWMKRICDIVQIYSDVKECGNEFNAIIKYSLFIFIFYLMVSVSSTLLTLQFQLLDNNAKLSDTFIVSMFTFWIFGDLFFICELGERTTDHFDMFYKELEQCAWHTLPIEMQRIFLIFLSDTQQPKNVTCYGNILCTRDTFKTIINKGSSYFIALRHLET